MNLQRNYFPVFVQFEYFFIVSWTYSIGKVNAAIVPFCEFYFDKFCQIVTYFFHSQCKLISEQNTYLYQKLEQQFNFFLLEMVTYMYQSLCIDAFLSHCQIIGIRRFKLLRQFLKTCVVVAYEMLYIIIHVHNVHVHSYDVYIKDMINTLFRINTQHGWSL